MQTPSTGAPVSPPWIEPKRIECAALEPHHRERTPDDEAGLDGQLPKLSATSRARSRLYVMYACRKPGKKRAQYRNARSVNSVLPCWGGAANQNASRRRSRPQRFPVRREVVEPVELGPGDRHPLDEPWNLNLSGLARPLGFRPPLRFLRLPLGPV
jgi:hypothetical protein